MKKFICFIALAALLSADAANPERPRRRDKRPIQTMTPPVYAPQNNADDRVNPAPTPEERAKFAAARKRRFEIMVLIGAYKIMPENERQALRTELLKRIEADFNATTADQKERLARAEENLKKMRKELSEREAQRTELVKRELDRLLKIQFPNRRRNPHQPGKNPAAPEKK